MKLTLTETQIKALQNGATMIVLPILVNLKDREKQSEEMGFNLLYPDYLKKLIEAYCPVQKGDKDVWIAEGFIKDSIISNGRFYKTLDDNKPIEFVETSKEQSRYIIGEILDVKVVKLKDVIGNIDTKNKKIIEKWTYHCTTEVIVSKRARALKEFYTRVIKEMNIDRTHDDNDYVFLIKHGDLNDNTRS